MTERKIRRITPLRIHKRYFFFGVLGVLGLFFGLMRWVVEVPPKPPLQMQTPEASSSSREKVIDGTLRRGDTLSSSLRHFGLPAVLVENICRNLRSQVDLRKVKPGDSFEVRLTPQDDFLNLTYRSSPVDIYQVSVQSSGEWQVQKKEIQVDKYWARVCGEIESSLFETMDRLGESEPLVLDFAEIFAWEIDFHSDPQPKDRFKILVEKYYVGGIFFKYGRILYAEYQSSSTVHQAFFFSPPGNRGDYFKAQGESLRKAFLKSPLKFTRITSRYSKSRYHPILGGYRPHYGVDYAAPIGSPIWAVADGTVLSSGWNGGYGKQIVLKHAQGYKTMYGHLSRIASGIKSGKRVEQKQIIGFVGSTGLSTGPHLDFRLFKNNIPRNPLKEISPPASPLPPAQLPVFRSEADSFLRWIQDESSPPLKHVGRISSEELDVDMKPRGNKS